MSPLLGRNFADVPVALGIPVALGNVRFRGKADLTATKRRCWKWWDKLKDTLQLPNAQTTNLGVRSSNLFGRASFLQFPCEFTRHSHGVIRSRS